MMKRENTTDLEISLREIRERMDDELKYMERIDGRLESNGYLFEVRSDENPLL